MEISTNDEPKEFELGKDTGAILVRLNSLMMKKDFFYLNVDESGNTFVQLNVPGKDRKTYFPIKFMTEEGEYKLDESLDFDATIELATGENEIKQIPNRAINDLKNPCVDFDYYRKIYKQAGESSAIPFLWCFWEAIFVSPTTICSHKSCLLLYHTLKEYSLLALVEYGIFKFLVTKKTSAKRKAVVASGDNPNNAVEGSSSRSKKHCVNEDEIVFIGDDIHTKHEITCSTLATFVVDKTKQKTDPQPNYADTIWIEKVSAAQYWLMTDLKIKIGIHSYPSCIFPTSESSWYFYGDKAAENSSSPIFKVRAIGKDKVSIESCVELSGDYDKPLRLATISPKMIFPVDATKEFEKMYIVNYALQDFKNSVWPKRNNCETAITGWLKLMGACEITFLSKYAKYYSPHESARTTSVIHNKESFAEALATNPTLNRIHNDDRIFSFIASSSSYALIAKSLSDEGNLYKTINSVELSNLYLPSYFSIYEIGKKLSLADIIFQGRLPSFETEVSVRNKELRAVPILFKPNGMKGTHTSTLIGELLNYKLLDIVCLDKMPEELFEGLYPNCLNRPYGLEWQRYLSSGPVTIIKVEGNAKAIRDSCLVARKASGLPWTKNIVHCPADTEELVHNNFLFDKYFKF
jgi:hypothetical protein